MKLRKQEIELIKTIQPRRLLEYLWANQWIETYEKTGVYKIFCKESEGNEFEILVPLNQEYSDFSDRLNEAFVTLSIAEKIEVISVIEDIKSVNVDIIRVRFDSFESRDGNMPLTQGVNFIKRAYEVVAAAASSTAGENSKAFYVGKRPADVEEYLKKVKLGQTERGSYVVTIQSPIPFIDQVQILDEAEEAFPRKVVTNLMHTLTLAKATTQTVLESGDINAFKNQIDNGVSANLCQAVFDLQSESPSANLDFSCKWAPNYRPPRETPEQIIFTPQEIPVLESAANLLKEIEPLLNYPLRGIIVKLERRDVEQGGNVTIVSYNEDNWERKMVHMNLEKDDYDRAASAHKAGHVVSCSGELTKEGKFWYLRNHSDFQVENIITN